MRTNIVIDDELMEEAISASGFQTKKDTVEAALRLLIAVRRQADIRRFRGRLNWEGDLAAMRAD